MASNLKQYIPSGTSGMDVDNSDDMGAVGGEPAVKVPKSDRETLEENWSYVDSDKRAFIRSIWLTLYEKYREVVNPTVEDLISQTTISAEVLNVIKAYRQSKNAGTFKSTQFFTNTTPISITLHEGTTVSLLPEMRLKIKSFLSTMEALYPNVPSPKKMVNGTMIEIVFQQGFVGDLIKFAALAHSIRGNITDIRFVNNFRRKTAIETERKVPGDSVTKWGGATNQIQLFRGLNWTSQMKSSNAQALGVGTCLVEYCVAEGIYRRSWAKCLSWKVGAWPFRSVIEMKMSDYKAFDAPEVGAMLQYASVVGTRDRRRYAYPPEFLRNLIIKKKYDFTFSNVETLADYNRWAQNIGLDEEVYWLWNLCVTGCAFDDGAVIEHVTGKFMTREECRGGIRKLCRLKDENGKAYDPSALKGTYHPIVANATNLSSAQYMSDRSTSLQSSRNAFMSGYCRSNLENIVKEVKEDTRVYGTNLTDIVGKEMEILRKKGVVTRGNMKWHKWSGSSFIQTEVVIEENGKLFFGGSI